jgi:hypothetical protein
MSPPAAAAAAANQILHRTRGQAMLLKQKAGTVPNQEHSKLARSSKTQIFLSLRREKNRTIKQTNKQCACYIYYREYIAFFFLAMGKQSQNRTSKRQPPQTFLCV